MEPADRPESRRLARHGDARADGALLVLGLLGWSSAAAALYWLTRHDSGDPVQWPGGVLVSTALGCLLACSIALGKAVFRERQAPRDLRSWLAVLVGGGYVLGALVAFLTSRFG